MRVFVTGGTGHFGSYIIPELIAAGHEVTGLAQTYTFTYGPPPVEWCLRNHPRRLRHH